MRYLLLIAGVILIWSGTSFAAGPIGGAELEAFMDQVIERQMAEQDIVGATVSVVADGEVVLNKGYGYADLPERTPVDAERTLFRIGSVSKLMTWTAIMQLVEEGKLDLDADVNNYLDFTIPQTLKGSPLTSPPDPITVKNLMTHTAGFEDVGEGLFYLSKNQQIPLDEYVRMYRPARVFPPGEVPAYSNYGAALAGYIVKRVSGQPFPRYVEENIFRPLGMDHSTFQQLVPDRLARNVAKGYRLVDGEYLEGDFVYVLTPAGGMSTTAADMAKFMNGHLQGGALGGTRILKPATVRRMHAEAFTPHPSLDGMALGFMERTMNGHRTLFHGGSIVLFNSGLFLLPEENVGLFVSYNGGGELTPVDLFHAFMDQYYPADGSPPPTPASGALQRAQAFVGEYHANRRSFTTKERILTLMNTIRIDVDEDGYLLATHLGQTDRFVEIRPGLYRTVRKGNTSDPYGAFRTLLFQEGPSGRIMLLPDGPMSYTKAPWYATSGFTGSAMLVILLILVTAPIYWFIRFLGRLFRRRQYNRPRPAHSKVAIAARLAAAAFGLATLQMLMGYLRMLGDTVSAFGLPKVFFGIQPAGMETLSMLPLALVVIAAAMVIFTVYGWRKGYWRVAGRIHYTLVTVAALGLLTMLNY